MKVPIVLALTLIGTKVSMAADLVCTTREADIVFALHGSRSLTVANFTLQKHFAADVSAAFKVGSNNTRFETLIFSQNDSSSPKWGVPRPSSAPVVSNAKTGLIFARYVMLRARPTATKVVIIIIAGQSPQPGKTKEAAMDLKNRNVTVLAIAVGNAAQSEVLDIVSQPDYAFKVDSYKVIQTLKDDVIKKMCQATGGHNNLTTR